MDVFTQGDGGSEFDQPGWIREQAVSSRKPEQEVSSQERHGLLAESVSFKSAGCTRCFDSLPRSLHTRSSCKQDWLI